MIKKIFTWCKGLILDRPLFWALGLLFVMPMLSYYIFFFLTPEQQLNLFDNRVPICEYHFSGSALCEFSNIQKVTTWVMGFFYFGCAFFLLAILIFLKNKFGLRKLMYVLMGIALIGFGYLFWKYEEGKRMQAGTIETYALSSSFVGETLVLTSSGMVPIEKIRVGDLVMSLNTDTQENTISTVVAVFKRNSGDILEINHSLKVTSKHPFALVDFSGKIFWKIAEEIQIGDCLFSEKRKCVRVENVEYTEVDTQDVFNMHVKDEENYFVFMGGNPILVHNKQAIPPEMKAQADAYWNFVGEINTKYPWAHMSLENGYYAIRLEGKEEIHFQLFTGPGGEETRIPIEQIKEAIEKTLTASTTPKEVPSVLNDEALLLRKRIENCEISSVVTTFGGDQQFATEVELSDGSKFTDVISKAELQELQGVLKDKCPFRIRMSHYDY